MYLQDKLNRYWTKQHFPAKSQPVLVAVSGGRDSMVLASLLLRGGYTIALAHCNFQLRGVESEQDEELVRHWAAQNDLTIHTAVFDTQKSMKDWNMGVQETARRLRYDWFSTLCKENGYHALATAHHAGDNAETLLINLCKGTGIAGLHGIPPKNGLTIRPMLFATREEIDAFAREYSVPFREDASNASVKYLRNAVRHQVLPTLESVFPGVTGRLNENIVRFGQVEHIYRQAMEVKIKKLLEKRGKDFYLPIKKLKKEQALETVCFELFTPFNFAAAQVPEIIKLTDSESGHYITSSSHRLIRNRDFLVLTEHKTEHTDLIVVDQFPYTVFTGHNRFIFKSYPYRHIIPLHDPSEALIDFDKVDLPLIVRRWRTGDYFYPLGMGMKKKKLSRFLVDQKVALHEKENIWILESNQKIIWVIGMRLDERFKLTQATKNVLQIKAAGV